jgi:hypothetical protein
MNYTNVVSILKITKIVSDYGLKRKIRLSNPGSFLKPGLSPEIQQIIHEWL